MIIEIKLFSFALLVWFGSTVGEDLGIPPGHVAVNLADYNKSALSQILLNLLALKFIGRFFNFIRLNICNNI